MGKPPFQFKPSKPPSRQGQEVQLVGNADVVASYSDVFVVAHEAETGMASLYFYQRELPDRQVSLEKTEIGVAPNKARCVSRVVMSPQGIERLLTALAQNRGFTLTPIKEEKK
jgi:hypothetical protein